jgi:peptidase C39-like protein
MNNLNNPHSPPRRIAVLMFISVVLALHYFSYAGSAEADTFTPDSVLLDVPYASQVPLGEWNDPRQTDGCEEASILMAIMWAQGLNLSPGEIRQQVTGMSDYEQYFYGYFQDSSAQDTAKLMAQYFGYRNVAVQYGISTFDIKRALDVNQLVIVPLNPRIISTTLYNKATTRHTVVVTGYDNLTHEIIFHDPLLVHGANRRVAESVFNSALTDYPSGPHLKNTVHATAIITVSKPPVTSF